MLIPSVDKVINKIVNNFETRDPYKIAKELDVIIVEEDLGEIYGYYSKVSRIPIIHINSRYDDFTKRFICGHELGHSLLHPNENTPMLSKISILSEMKIEKEANYFAANLIIDGSHEEFELINKYQILDFYGLPYEFKRYCKNF